jgi:hypothetical protein
VNAITRQAGGFIPAEREKERKREKEKERRKSDLQKRQCITEERRWKLYLVVSFHVHEIHLITFSVQKGVLLCWVE